MNLRFANYDTFTHIQKNRDTYVCIVLLIESLGRVLDMFDVWILAAITSHPGDHRSDTGDHCPMVWNPWEI